MAAHARLTTTVIEVDYDESPVVVVSVRPRKELSVAAAVRRRAPWYDRGEPSPLRGLIWHGACRARSRGVRSTVGCMADGAQVPWPAMRRHTREFDDTVAWLR